MKLQKLAGATSEIWQIFIRDSSSTTGAGLTGLVFNTASLTAYYHRDTDTTATAMTLVTMTVGTFTSLGFKEIDATNMPGWYQFCPPNAAIASGAKSCGFHLKGATNMASLPIEVQLTATNVDSATTFMTSVASVTGAVGSVTGAVGSVTGNVGGNVTGSVGSVVGAVASVTGAVGSVTGAVGSVTGNVGGNVTGTVASVTGNLGGNVAGDVNGKVIGGGATSITGDGVKAASVTGAVGSVTGSVASVTGNVGGNVVGNVNGNVSGSVGSVTGAVGSVSGAVGSVTGDIGGNLAGDVQGKVLGGGSSSITGSGVQASTVAGAVGSVTGAVGSVTGAVGSVTGDVGGNVNGKVLGGGAGSISGDGVRASSVTGAVGSVTGAVGSVTASVTLGSSERNSIATALLDLANGVETSVTLRQALRLFASALNGKVSGAGTTTVVFRDINDTKDRITATVDVSGNRTAITNDAT